MGPTLISFITLKIGSKHFKGHKFFVVHPCRLTTVKNKQKDGYTDNHRMDEEIDSWEIYWTNISLYGRIIMASEQDQPFLLNSF